MGNGLTHRHTAKSLLVFAMPTIIMMIFMSLYTMVDGIFVANFVSADALAGLNLVIPAPQETYAEFNFSQTSGKLGS